MGLYFSSVESLDACQYETWFYLMDALRDLVPIRTLTPWLDHQREDIPGDLFERAVDPIKYLFFPHRFEDWMEGDATQWLIPEESLEVAERLRFVIPWIPGSPHFQHRYAIQLAKDMANAMESEAKAGRNFEWW